MPYLDVCDEEDFAHLMQLYQAAHPHCQVKHAARREDTCLEGDYFLSVETAHDLGLQPQTPVNLR